MRIQSSFSTAQ